ncbi:MAG: restriction endonuclease subunit S [Rhodocyclaceae bacterium]|uniref:Restriction endonuclease subunit S n=1 Tax=Candidatus Desulfobacillus denitrificans TaxID=2608985 RepID=A0A809R504_9PROT|nr:restriction endonuclease subunit S [Candidatus Desulfobacillus denitrificans]GIK45434.1 MAG: restriction endonuclease subunit S [Betaproteobacteria bacterium]GJQ54322.1 MAG: restriction endonuclease subunit S [Rhodocyclaceae bacterium]
MKAGWQHKTIDAVCDVVNGGTPKTGTAEYWDGPHQWITPAEMGKRATPFIELTERALTDAGLQNSSARLLPAQSVILSTRAPIGYLVINTVPMATNQGCKGLVPRAGLDCKFLYYYLTSIVPLLNDLGTGATFKELSGGKLKEVPIPVPSFPEQHRIVAILDEAFDSIATAKANAEQNLQNARALFESHLHQVFTERGEGWVERLLEEVVSSTCSLSYGIVQPGDDFRNGLPVVRPTDLTTQLITADRLKRIDPKLANGYKRTALRGGELLLCVRGSTGIVSVAAPELAGANVTRGIVPITFEPSILRQGFGYFLMISEMVQNQIRAKTYGTALMQINIGDLRKVTVAIPPIAQQEAITAKLELLQSETQHLESLYQQKLAALDEWKKSLLHRAFSGQL